MKRLALPLLALIVFTGCKSAGVFRTEQRPDPANPNAVIEVRVPVMDDMGTPDDPTDDVQKTEKVPDFDLISQVSLIVGPQGPIAVAGIVSLVGIADRLLKGLKK